MSDGTVAVPRDLVEDPSAGKRRSLCPVCSGKLHPYKIHVDLGGYQGWVFGSAWVAVCVGGISSHTGDEWKPCGFSVRLEPHQ